MGGIRAWFVLGANTQIDPTLLWVAGFGFLGILVTQITLIVTNWMNRGKVKGVEEKVEEVHKEVKSGNNKSTGKAVESIDRKIDRIEGQLDDLRTSIREIQEDVSVESSSWATIFAAHISDGHDPTGKWSANPEHRRNRRFTDPKDY